jgi:hypothetical protein
MVITEASLFTSANRPLSAFATASLQHEMWNGEIDSYTLGLTLRAGSHMTLSPSLTHSRADLPGGGFVASVSGLRLGWAFSTRLSAQAYVQYNSLEQRFVGNLRLRFIHRPGSDLYLVFNEERGAPDAPGALVSRGFVTKLSYLWRF